MLAIIPILNVGIFIYLMVIILWGIFVGDDPTREEIDTLNSELREVRREIRELKYGGDNIRDFEIPSQIAILEKNLRSITLGLYELEGVVENKDKLRKVQELYEEEQRHEEAKKLIKQEWK